MRTTIDLPEDLHRQATAIARDTHRTLSETVSCLIRRGLSHPSSGESVRSSRTGLHTVGLGKVITSQDVRLLEEE